MRYSEDAKKPDPCKDCGVVHYVSEWPPVCDECDIVQWGLVDKDGCRIWGRPEPGEAVKRYDCSCPIHCHHLCHHCCACKVPREKCA